MIRTLLVVLALFVLAAGTARAIDYRHEVDLHVIEPCIEAALRDAGGISGLSEREAIDLLKVLNEREWEGCAPNDDSARHWAIRRGPRGRLRLRSGAVHQECAGQVEPALLTRAAVGPTGGAAARLLGRGAAAVSSSAPGARSIPGQARAGASVRPASERCAGVWWGRLAGHGIVGLRRRGRP